MAHNQRATENWLQEQVQEVRMGVNKSNGDDVFAHTDLLERRRKLVKKDEHGTLSLAEAIELQALKQRYR